MQVEIVARRRGLPLLEIENQHPSAEDLLASPQCQALLENLLPKRRAGTGTGGDVVKL